MADEMETVRNGRDFVVKIPFPEGRIYFNFSEISRSHQSFTAFIVVLVESTKEGILDEYRQRLDLNSHSAVEGFRRSLQNAYDMKSIKWAIVINKAFNSIVSFFNEEQKPTNFKGMAAEASMFLFHPFLQEDANNMVFGDSEVGKSYFCLRMAASLASGHPFVGFTPPEAGKRTLFLDYEDSGQVFNRRLFEIAAGMGISKDTLDEHIWWFKPDGSLRDLAEVIARMVEEYTFDLIIIDAGSNAAGGSPNDEEKVVGMFNALERIPCTKLIIHHEPKDSEGKADNKAYYGTVFWRALTRIAWRLSVENEEDGKLVKAAIAKKSNMGRIDPFYYLQKWEMGEIGESFGPVTMTRHDIQKKSGEEKILEALKEHGELTSAQLREFTGIGSNYFKEISQRLREQGKIDLRGIKRGALWYTPPNGNTPPNSNSYPPND